MEAIPIADGVYDVGVVDWNIRDFHGYSTDLGTTYNAYLITDDKTILVDTVRKGFADQLIECQSNNRCIFQERRTFGRLADGVHYLESTADRFRSKQPHNPGHHRNSRLVM